MKRICTVALAIALALSLTACRRKKAPQTEPTTRATVPTTTATTEPTRVTTPPTTVPSTEMTMPDATGNIGDTDDGIIGDDIIDETGILPDMTDATEETQARNRIKTPGTVGGRN